MKNLKKISLFSALLLLWSCGGSDSPEEIELEAPQLVSSTPANGATEVADGDLTLTLTYDQNVTSPSATHSQVTISGDGAVVESLSAAYKNVTVKVTGLLKGCTYELTVPKGVVLGPTKLEAATVRVSFKTVEEKQVTPVSAELCTKNPLPATQKVFDYLTSVYGEKTLSGTMANVAWNVSEAELVYKATGKYPAMAFFDYIHLAFSPANWIDYGDTKVVEDWWNAGGLVGASWHWMVPEKEGAETVVSYTEETSFHPKNIFVEGTWEQKTAQADLEELAGYLLLLQEKGIPVIWRPLHEAAGNTYEYNGGTAWFWWGRDGAEVYRKLWIYLFDFLKEKGINNLIWVWTTQTKDADFYPGDAYVDIVGRDLYNVTAASDAYAQYYTILQGYSDKPIALSECGSVAKISEQWKAGARWSWFMPWYQYDATTLVGHEHADEAWWKDAMSQSYVITRDALPSWK